MARSIGKMSVTLAANATQFSATMKNAKADVKATADSVANAQGRIKAAIDDRDKFEERVQAKMASRLKSLEAQKVREAVQAEATNRLKAAGLSEADAGGKGAGKKYGDSFLGELNSTFGKKSTMGKLMKLAMGGGAIGALGSAANEFNELTKKAEELALAMKKPGDEWKDTASQLITSIPVVGALADGFARIWSIASGEAATVAKIKEETAEIQRINEAYETGMKVVAAAHKETLDIMIQERRERELLGKSAGEKEALQTSNEEEDKVRKANESRAAKLKEIRESFDKARQPLTKAYADTMASLPNESGDEATKKSLELSRIRLQQDALTKRQAADEARVNAEAQQQILEATKTGWAKRWQAAKDGLEKVRDAYDESAKAEGEKAKANADSMAKARDEATQNQIDEIAANAKKGFEEEQAALAKLKEKTATPMEAFTSRAQQLADWRKADRITADEFKRGTAEAWDELKKTIKLPDNWSETKSPDLILGGSAQSQRFAYDFAAGSQRMSKDDELKQKQLTAQQDANVILRRIDTSLAVEVVEIGN